VKYDGNGSVSGSVPIDSNSYEEGTTVTVKPVGTLVRSGFTFITWNTVADGSGTSYAPGETFQIGSSNITLYAKWTSNPTYTVSYYGNGNSSGNGIVDGNNYEEGDTVTVKATGNLDRSGYSFTGWNTAEDGTGTNYLPGSTFKMGSEDVILYAKWTNQPTYTVSYDGNGNTAGSAPIDNNNYEETNTVTVKTIGTLARASYSFTGWNTVANGSGTSYTPGNTFEMGSSDIILYAQWTINPTYTVTYNGNNNTGGTAPIDSNNYEEATTVTVKTIGTLVRTGYTFTGWNTIANGSGSSYAPGDTFEMGSSNVFLYAQWTNNPTYTVTYNGNNNTGGTAPVDGTNYQQGDTVTVSPVGTLVRTGYTFSGWNTIANGSGTSHAAGSTFAMGSTNVILYAQWTSNPTYTVTYDGNNNTGGTAPVDNTNYQQGDTITASSVGTLVRTGYTFSGWNTVANGSGTSHAAGSTFAMGSSNVILYAQWTSTTETFKISFGATTNLFGTIVAGWNSNSMDVIPTAGIITYNTNGVDSGVRIGVPSGSASVSKKRPITNVTSTNSDFPTAVILNAFKGYSAFVNTGLPSLMEITGLTVGHNYSFKIFSSIDVATAGAGFTTANSQVTNISIVGTTTVNNSMNPIDNTGTLITQGTVQPTAEGKITIQLSAPINWGQCAINAMIITKD